MRPLSWRVNAERLVLLGWSRAILLQLAHPLVAAGVAEHSTFRGGPLTAVSRLHQTVHAMLSLTFGDADAKARTLETIRTIHRRVNGRLPAAVGAFDAGTPYSAEDPALLLWVHVTLLDSVLLVYDAVIAPLSTAERDLYCTEAAHVAVALGARDGDVPHTYGALRECMRTTLDSGTIRVSAQARELADAVLAPPLGVLTWPAARINRLVTVGLLPAEVRRQYGFGWDDKASRWFLRSLAAIAAARRLVPQRVAWWAAARR